MKIVDEFDAEGKKYYEIQAELAHIKNRLTSLKKHGIITPAVDEAFSQARKDAALWAKSQKEYDDAVRGQLGKLWRAASPAERKAAFDYTAGSGAFNRPLRGYKNDWDNFKGIGKVGLNNEGQAKGIKELTSLIDKSFYDKDIWLQRGVKTEGAAEFLGISESELRSLTQYQLNEKLKGVSRTDTAFISCGSAQGTGFNGHIFKIFCPKGTKMLYCEPFSDFGRGAKSDTWNGVTKQKEFGREFETIIQRGTKFRITKIEKYSDHCYFEMEVVGQISGGK